MLSFDVVITVNSPGEVAGWLAPMAAALRSCPWAGRTIVFTPPCTFASGSECRAIGGMPEVDLVYGPGAFVRFVLLGLRPRGYRPAGRGVVLFLGGDLANAALLARRLRYPALAYTEGRAAWLSSYARFALPYETMRAKLLARGVPADKLEVVGNLMLDAPWSGLGADEVRGLLGIGGRPLVLLLPGSRPAHVEYMAPFLLETAARIHAFAPEAAFALSISPFVDDRRLAEALSSPGADRFGRPGSYTPGAAEPAGETDWAAPGRIGMAGGPVVIAMRGRQHELMAAADLALTIPGTNTFELARHGTPTIVLLETGYPERIPLEGIPGLLGGLPVVGRILKRHALPRIMAKVPFAAWPNRLAGGYVVPELRGRIEPGAAARAAAGLLADAEERTRMKKSLLSVVGQPGASHRLATLAREVAEARFGEQ